MKKIILLCGWISLMTLAIGCSTWEKTFYDPKSKISVYERKDVKSPLIPLIIGTVFDFVWYEDEGVGIIPGTITVVLTPTRFVNGTLLDFEVKKDDKLIAYSQNNLLHAPIETLNIAYYIPTLEDKGVVTVIDVSEKGPFWFTVIAHDNDANILGKREILFKLDQPRFLEERES